MFGSFPPSPLVVCASKVYSGLGADIVMELFHPLTSFPEGNGTKLKPQNSDFQGRGKAGSDTFRWIPIPSTTV